jgi:hypothetical protein
METIRPKSVREKDAIKALKSATNDYCQHHFNRLFAFGGDMMASVPQSVWDDVNEALQNVEVDEFGRDANGLDIDAAHYALEMVKGE